MTSFAVFNPRRQQLLRTHVSRGENIVVIVLAVMLLSMVYWVASTRDAYDPGRRDIAPELLAKSEQDKTLFVAPLKLLTDPNAAPAASNQVQALFPFPAAIVSGGWSLASRVKQFDEANLFEKINGEAPKFLKQGFQSLNYVVLASTSSGAEIGVELFDQGDLGGSLGVFGDHRGAGVDVESVDGVDYFSTSVGAIGRRGQYFFRIVGDAATTEVQEKSRQLVAALAALAPDTAEVAAPLALLTQTLGFDQSEVTLQKANVFKFDFATNFWFASTEPGSIARVFVHESGDGASAAELFSQLETELSFDYESMAAGEDDDVAVLKHNFLDNYFALSQSKRWIFGIENAETEAAARTAIARVSAALEERAE